MNKKKAQQYGGVKRTTSMGNALTDEPVVSLAFGGLSTPGLPLLVVRLTPPCCQAFFLHCAVMMPLYAQLIGDKIP